MEGLTIAFWEDPYLRQPSKADGGGGGGFTQLLALVGEQDVSSGGKMDLSDTWRQLQGSENWASVLDPIHPSLRAEIFKYGKFADATYSAYDFDPDSELCGTCRYAENRLLDKVGLGNSGYVVTGYLYATIADLPTPANWWVQWLSSLMGKRGYDADWMGFVTVSDDEETRRLGRRDILVAWRGTVVPAEWLKDAQWSLEPLGVVGVEVEHGFHSLHTAKSDSCAFTNSSASQQVMAEIWRLVEKYHGERKEVVSLTVTGHSLGGALALLNAHEAGAARIPGLDHVSVVSFGAPEVGNAAFVDEVAKVGVKLLRVVIKEDMVPRLPGLDGFQHGGVELELDSCNVPGFHIPLLDWLDVVDNHSLKTYLLLVQLKRNWPSTPVLPAAVSMPRRREKLKEALRVRECWYRMVDLGLVQGPPGWTRPEREPEDVPSLAS